MTATRSLAASLQHLSRALLAADLAGRFAERRDEAAFAALVRRHGALVFGVCRRVLRQEQDAEDAFQATFVVFAREAASLRQAGAVGNWLYGVAFNVARRAKAARDRRTIKEQEAAARRPATTSEVVPDDLRDVLDRELSALPEKYRAAVVLCDLVGQTAEQAAAGVGCPPKTLGTRLARGRALLARRLARRGVGLSAALTAAVLTPAATAAIPPRLIESAVQLASNPVTVAPAIAALTAGVSNVMVLKTLKVGAVLACGVLFVGGVALHGGFAAHGTPASARTGPAVVPIGQKPAGRAKPSDPLAHLHQFFRYVHELLGIEPAHARAAVPDDKKGDKPSPAGVWVKKGGELRIEFADKGVLNIAPHGDGDVILIVCEYAADKDGRVKVKVTGFEGKAEAKKAVMEKLPVGTAFSFKWAAKGDTATLDDVKGDKGTADLLKSHLEAEFSKK
jgi:RNA polymerase sigma factor (sigma-70 family)